MVIGGAVAATPANRDTNKVSRTCWEYNKLKKQLIFGIQTLNSSRIHFTSMLVDKFSQTSVRQMLLRITNVQF